MKRKTILAVLLMLVLLISMVGYAEPNTEIAGAPAEVDTNAGVDVSVEPDANEGADVSAEPDAGVDADAAAQPDANVGAVAPVASDQLIRKPLYYIIVDCGYAFYGSEKYFDTSLAAYPGDPKGEVLKVLEGCLSELVQEDACVVVRGYHSDVLGAGEPVSVLNKEAYAAQFNVLRLGDRTKYYSSKLDVALRSCSEEIAAYAGQYDCTLVLLTGGCVNYYGNKTSADLAGLKDTIDNLRNAGVAIHAFGLAGEGIEDNLSAAFADGEYTAIALNAAGADVAAASEDASAQQIPMDAPAQTPVDAPAQIPVDAPAQTPVDEAAQQIPVDAPVQLPGADDTAAVVDVDAAYAQARTRMTVELAKMLADCAGQPYEWKGFASQDEALAYLGAQNDSNAVLAFFWNAENGSRCLRQNNSEMQNMVSKYHVYDNYKYISFLVLTDTTEASSAEKEAEEQAQRQLISDFTNFYTTLSAQLAAPVDCADDPVSIQLPQSYDPEKVRFEVAEAALLGAEVREGCLVLTPQAVGQTELTLNVQGADPVELPVSVVDYRLSWSFENGATLSSGELSVSAYDCGDLYWTLRDSKGNAIAGNSVDAAQAQSNGMSCRLVKDGAQWTLSFGAQEIGQYSIDVESRKDGAAMTTETRSFLVQREIKASVEEVRLIWPYFKQQDGQLVQISYKDDDDTPVALSDYAITAEPEGVVEAYTSMDGGALYIVPVGKGTARVTVAEQGVETPNAAVVTVTVRALTSNVMLWVCGVGAVLCLILLTAAIVIIIGKRSRKG